MKLTMKVFCIIGITLFLGFSVMGITSIWLGLNSTIRLHESSSKVLATAIRQTIEEFMMKNDLDSTNRYVSQLKQKKTVLDLVIFGREGKTPGVGRCGSLGARIVQKRGTAQCKTRSKWH